MISDAELEILRLKARAFELITHREQVNNQVEAELRQILGTLQQTVAPDPPTEE